MEKIPEAQGSINELINLAKLNTDEAWEEIDGQIPQYCNDPMVLDWAKKNTANPDSGLSDLAATILEASDETLDAQDINNLTSLMRSNNKENPYPSFRAACALAKRSTSHLLEKPLLSEIKNKLEAFAEDEVVSDIAKSYLDSLSE